MISDMMNRDPIQIIEAAAEMIERTKKLLAVTDDRLRLSRLQLERSRQLMERFVDFERQAQRRQRPRG